MIVFSLVALVLVAGASSVQDAPVSTVAVPATEAPAGSATSVPLRTTVEIEIMQVLGSKTSKGGDKFPIRLAEALVVDGRTVLPKGLTGEGEVVHAAKARWGGKAGELVLAARYLDCPATAPTSTVPGTAARRIPLGYFKFGVAGKALTYEALLIPVVGAFIGGGEVDVVPGTRANAQTKEVIELTGSADMACPAPTVTIAAAAGEIKP